MKSLKNSGYELISVSEYLSRQDGLLNRPVAIIRHDIDRRIHKALVFADIESNSGISATYYFRYAGLYSPDMIRYVSSRDHEIGYHYEVLSRTSGDFDKANELFKKDLLEFRKIASIQTVCMHGAPLSKYDNLSFWNNYGLRDFALIGEAFLSISGVEYFSDTGRSWSPKHKIRDILPGDMRNFEKDETRSTNDLINYIEMHRPPALYIITHPERWAETRIEWIYLYWIDFVVNSVKSVLSFIRGLSH